ncbi:MAG: type II toxin-antitoxin system RelE/ParE family toxin [Pseudomonadota bacterium]|nr:type II toxin-antitoxin system RelE/ParE family toxin [Pseudomonadota bacterium]
MAWLIRIDDAAQKDLEKIDKPIAKGITTFLRDRISVLENPRTIGEPLKSSRGELWRYRVGDYRLICEINDSAVCILVVKIGNRREVYR